MADIEADPDMLLLAKNAATSPPDREAMHMQLSRSTSTVQTAMLASTAAALLSIPSKTDPRFSFQSWKKSRPVRSRRVFRTSHSYNGAHKHGDGRQPLQCLRAQPTLP